MFTLWLIASLALAIVHATGSTTIPSSGDPNCNTYEYSFLKDTTVVFPVGTVTTWNKTIYPKTTAPVSTLINYRSTVTTTSTSTVKFTSYITKASSTKTIATSKGFIPLASLKPTLPPPRNYTATLIQCITFTTLATSTDLITISPTKTKTTTAVSTFTTTISTSVHVSHTVSTSVATVYAGCLTPANMVKKYKNKPINNYDSIRAANDYPELPVSPRYRAANQSPQDCCNAVHAAGQADSTISGFVFTGTFEDFTAYCQPLGAAPSFDLDGWQFSTGAASYGYEDLVMGAGPKDPGVLIYAGECEGNGCPFYNEDYKYYGYSS